MLSQFLDGTPGPELSAAATRCERRRAGAFFLRRRFYSIRMSKLQQQNACARTPIHVGWHARCTSLQRAKRRAPRAQAQHHGCSRPQVDAPAGISLFPRHAPTAHAWSVIKDSHTMHASYPQRIPPQLVPPYKGGNAIPASCPQSCSSVRVLASHTLSHRARVRLRRRRSGDTTRARGRTETHDAPGRAPAAPPLASRSPPHALPGYPVTKNYFCFLPHDACPTTEEHEAWRP